MVEAQDADDVTALVRYARKAGLTVSTQPSGHGATGDVEGVVLLRTNRLGGVEVRPEERVARLGAGVRWGELQGQRGPRSHRSPGQLSGGQRGGLRAGRGLGWFSRRHGFASDSVRALDVVTPDGDLTSVTASSDPDLFWALREAAGTSAS
ncbi:FAD-binding protein [Oerskovia sp. M15]